MNPFLASVAFILCLLLGFVVADIVKATYTHYSRGNAHHPMPLPVHFAFLVAVVEVCWDRPLALHRARMNIVRQAEARRQDANQRARAAAMAAHPSAYRSTLPNSTTA